MRLGDLDALKKHMCELCNQDYSDEPCEPSDCVFYNAVEKATTIDAVPVVRCRDCVHYKKGSCNLHSVWPDEYSNGYDCRPDDDDFCSYGER